MKNKLEQKEEDKRIIINKIKIYFDEPVLLKGIPGWERTPCRLSRTRRPRPGSGRGPVGSPPACGKRSRLKRKKSYKKVFFSCYIGNEKSE